MESAIQTVVKVYLKASKGKDNLGGKEFQTLVKGQLSNILTDTDSSKAVSEMRQGLDSNQDGKVNFEEYLKLVGYLATTLSQQREAQKEQPAQSTEEAHKAESTPASDPAPDVEEAKIEEEPPTTAAVKVENKPVVEEEMEEVEVEEEVEEEAKVEPAEEEAEKAS